MATDLDFILYIHEQASLIDAAIDDPDLLRRLLIVTAEALPRPAPKAPRKSSKKKAIRRGRG